MDKMYEAIRDKLWLRWVLVGLTALIVAFSVMPNDWQGAIAYFLGPAVALGGIIGFLTWDKKQWLKVVEKYQDFLSFVSKGIAVDSFKENMQSAYINWANEYYKNEDWIEVNRILSMCVISKGETELCQNNLSEVRKSHRLD